MNTNKRKLLLVIDLQKGWRHPQATEPTFLRAIDFAKKFDGDVVHCCFRNDPASLFHTQIKWSRFVDPEDTDQIPEIEPLHLPIEWRTTYSCVTDSFKPTIALYDEVYIVGVFTDISVMSTAMDIFDMNTPVIVVRDCVATLHGEAIHHAALKSLGFAIGDKYVIDAAEALETT